MTRAMLAFASCSLVVVAGRSVSHAQFTQLSFEASRDAGQTWSSLLDASPGDTVYVQMRVRLYNSPAESVLGLAGLIHQPTLSGWGAGDERLPFSSSDGSGVPAEPATNTGRILRFASSGMNSGSVSGSLVSHVDPGGVLRFAGANATTLTTDLRWGVGSGQLAGALGDLQFGLDVIVFRYAVRLDPAEMIERTLVASAPIEGVLNRRASWYRTMAGTNSLQAPIDPLEPGIFPATIHVIPSPPALLALCGSVLLITRRRRH